ncbi:LacI family transcriptional regulator [Saccharopolyspora sp. K220]|uniref:LacI family DNA-binding transcriptional regulator n=1 Tax=Saccharopolyspora soli TaxID=2926618 RepID=UPI001F56C178|nr:LacI family DNA-binding transcriptional regulator [Saccharopolyspora soli]MCI2424100.1 LacI family transcriptional regulator [Saccharopolyspora soli]
MSSGRREMSRAVTIKDVARAAQVSIATASEALSGRGRMTPETRRKVVDIAGDLGYVANALAKGLRTGRTHAIGVHHRSAAESLDRPYFRNFLAGAIKVAQAHDYDLAVLSSNPAVPRSTAPRVDGVIVTDPISDDTRARELMESRLPVVAGELLPDDMPPCAVVAVDHEPAVRQILRRVATLGVRSPLLVAPDRNSGWGNLLRRVFAEWCTEQGLPEQSLEVPFGDFSLESQQERLAGELGRWTDIDFILGASAFEIRGAAGALRELGKQPGRDVVLASCCDDESLEPDRLAVTSVVLPARALGAACVRRLIWLLDETENPDEGLGSLVTVPAEVAFRASTGTAR